MANPKKNEGDNTWAWGVDGWYCARNGWNDKYTKDLQDMGYVVVKDVALTTPPGPGPTRTLKRTGTGSVEAGAPLNSTHGAWALGQLACGRNCSR